jgi:hypothetical protein
MTVDELADLCRQRIKEGRDWVALTIPYKGRGGNSVRLLGRSGPLGVTRIVRDGYCAANFNPMAILKWLDRESGCPGLYTKGIEAVEA